VNLVDKHYLNKLQDLAEKAKKEDSAIIVREIVEEMDKIIKLLIQKE
jgi:hypothetical protein